MSRFTDLFQEPAPAPVVEQPVVEEVKVEPNISGNEGCTVTMFNTDGQRVVQMAPKQMKVIQQSADKIILRGYGHDMMGSSFADYGLTIHYNNGQVTKCILHMHERNVDIEYMP